MHVGLFMETIFFVGPSIVMMFVLRIKLEFNSKMKQHHNSPCGQPRISLSLSLHTLKHLISFPQANFSTLF